MPSPVHIRAATETDLESVRGLLVETWHDTYDRLIGADEVAAITDRWHCVPVLAAQLAAAGASFLVAEAARPGIVGHAFAEAAAPALLHLRRLYVLPAWQRQGIGARLMAEILARHADTRMLRLSVEADNARAMAFYRRQGFSIVADAIEGGAKVARMEKALGG